jgi:hypothetical protein
MTIAVILMASVACGSAAAASGAFTDISQRPKVWPKPTPPPDASPIYQDVKEPAASEEEIAVDAREHNARLEATLESAVQGADAQKREAAMVFVLPALLQLESARVVKLVERQKPGAARDLLRDDVARIWAAQDVHAAARWMKTLPAEQRRGAVVAAVVSLLPVERDKALRLARDFQLQEDHSLRKLLSPRN